MIKVMLGEEVRGRKASKWRWAIADVAGEALSGLARNPLLDACRALRRMGVNPSASAGLYREGKVDSEGRPAPDLTCTVGDGARTTVMENAKSGPRFVKWVAHPMAPVRLTGVTVKTHPKIDGVFPE